MLFNQLLDPGRLRRRWAGVGVGADVWRRDLRAVCGCWLAGVLRWPHDPLLRGIRDNDRALIVVGIAVLAFARAGAALAAGAVGAEA